MSNQNAESEKKGGSKVLVFGIVCLAVGFVLFGAAESLSWSPLSGTFRVLDEDRMEVFRFMAEKLSLLGVGLVVASVFAPGARRVELAQPGE
jgi:hypothetical protein